MSEVGVIRQIITRKVSDIWREYVMLICNDTGGVLDDVRFPSKLLTAEIPSMVVNTSTV